MMRRTLSSSAWTCLLGVFGLVLAAACGDASSSSSGGGNTGSGASTGTSTGGAGGAGGSVLGGCNPACTEPQICSTVGVCIDPGSCAADGDCTMAGTHCDTMTKQCVPGGGCGAQEAKVEAIPPNLLIVLDRSCSMTDAVGMSNKWKIAVDAISKMTTGFKGQIRFGLALFPDLVAPACGQDQIPIPVGEGNEMAIQDLLTAALAKADKYYPDGPCETNIDTAIKQASTEPAFADTMRDSYVLLMTDGKQSAGCDPNGTADATTQKTIKNMHDMKNVSTFVLGFGSGVDAAQMDKFANAGGVPSAGAHKYYDASDEASLDAALDTIAKKTLSCSYVLEQVPPDPDQIYVFFDNVNSIPRDTTHMAGWDYDMAKNEVTFYGTECQSLKDGSVKDLDIVLGCNEPTPN